MLWIVKDKKIMGITDNPNLNWEGYEVKEGPDLPQQVLYVDDDGAIAILAESKNSTSYLGERSLGSLFQECPQTPVLGSFDLCSQSKPRTINNLN